MAISDWMNATVGNASLGDIGKTAVDLYDVWQGGKKGKDAADTMAGGYDKGMGVLEDVYDTTRGDIDPYLTAGTTALVRYTGLMQDPSTIVDDPGYQFRLTQGEEAVKRNLEAAGYADPMGSGANPMGITEYAQGFATNELDAALNRSLPLMNLGSDATRTGAVAGATYGQNMAEMYTGKAKQLATKDILDAQAMSGYLKGGKGLIDSIAGNETLQQLVKEALGGGTTSEGIPLWDLVSDAFGIDKGDVGVIESVKRMFGAGDIPMSGGMGVGAVSPIATAGMDALQFGGGDVGGLISGLSDATKLDWNSLFSLSGAEGGSGAGALEFPGLFSEASGGTGAVADMGALELGGEAAAEAGGLAGLGSWATTALGIPAAMYGISEFTQSLEKTGSESRESSLLSAQDPLQKGIDFISGEDQLRGKDISTTADTSSYYSESGMTNIGADKSEKDLTEETISTMAGIVKATPLSELQTHSSFNDIQDTIVEGFLDGAEGTKGAMKNLFPDIDNKLLDSYKTAESDLQNMKNSGNFSKKELDKQRKKVSEKKDQILAYV